MCLSLILIASLLTKRRCILRRSTFIRERITLLLLVWFMLAPHHIVILSYRRVALMDTDLIPKAPAIELSCTRALCVFPQIIFFRLFLLHPLVVLKWLSDVRISLIFHNRNKKRCLFMSRCRMLAETLSIHDLIVVPYRKALRFILYLNWSIIGGVVSYINPSIFHSNIWIYA